MKRFLAAGLMFLTACGRPEDRPLRIATYSILAFFPVFLAHELGHFRDEGLIIEFDEMNLGTKLVEALVGGSSDVGIDGHMYPVIMAAQGRQLKTFVNLYSAWTGLLVAGPGQNRIQTVADLKGATIGLGSLGGLHNRMLGHFLKLSGLKLSDVQIIPVGTTATAVAAIQYGKVQASVINGSLLPVIKQRAPGVRVILDARSRTGNKEIFGAEEFPSTGAFATSDWLVRNPDRARRFARAMTRTLAWIREHSPEEVMTRLPAKLKSANTAFDIEELRVLISLLSKDGRMTPDGAEAVRRVAAASMDNVKAIDVAATWTNEFVEERK